MLIGFRNRYKAAFSSPSPSHVVIKFKYLAKNKLLLKSCTKLKESLDIKNTLDCSEALKNYTPGAVFSLSALFTTVGLC